MLPVATREVTLCVSSAFMSRHMRLSAKLPCASVAFLSAVFLFVCCIQQLCFTSVSIALAFDRYIVPTCSLPVPGISLHPIICIHQTLSCVPLIYNKLFRIIGVLVL